MILSSSLSSLSVITRLNDASVDAMPSGEKAKFPVTYISVSVSARYTSRASNPTDVATALMPHLVTVKDGGTMQPENIHSLLTYVHIFIPIDDLEST